VPRVVGKYGEPGHDKLVEKIVEMEAFYRNQLTPNFQAMVNRWKLYMSDRPDTRLKHEKWRANTFVPYPYSGTETKVASLCEIMNSTDPPIQAEGVSTDDQRARKMERVHLYMLTKNRWGYQQDVAYRDMVVQGTHVWKLVNAHKSRRVKIHPTPDQIASFDQALEAAVQAGAPDPPDWQDLEAFEQWRELVNTSQLYGKVPEPPVFGETEIIEYRGPWLERPFIGDLRFDPMTEDMQAQTLVIHRIVKPRSWLLERTGSAPDKKFDEAQVAAALENTPEGRFSEWDDQIAQMLGITRTKDDPTYNDAVELWECWQQGDPTPYKVILNRKSIINKTPDVFPFWHGKNPFIPVRNVPLSRRLLGISDLQATDKLYREMNTLHDLLLDAVLLAVMPVFTKRRGSGLAENQRSLRPGGFLDVDMADAIQSLTKFDPGLQHAFRMIMDLKNNIDETNATPPHVRGGQALVGRVSASEFQGRLNQALVRTKQQVLRIEEEHQAIPEQAAFLWYQFGPEKVRLRIGGEDMGIDPFVEMQRADFLEVLNIDFRFRGATKSLNRELSAQQLDGWLKTATQAAAVSPKEVRTVLKKIYETQGHKNSSEIITDAGTEDLQAMWDVRVLQAKAALVQAQQQAQQQQLNGGTMPPEMAAAAGGEAPGNGAAAA
jgi:hypothetical protein